MNPVVHFEMPYDNRERMAGFYQAAFGWHPRMLGAEMGHYVSFMDTEGNRISMLQPFPRGGAAGG